MNAERKTTKATARLTPTIAPVFFENLQNLNMMRYRRCRASTYELPCPGLSVLRTPEEELLGEEVIVLVEAGKDEDGSTGMIIVVKVDDEVCEVANVVDEVDSLRVTVFVVK